MKRRTLLQLLLGLIATFPSRIRAFTQASALEAADTARLRAIADVVLPAEIGADGQARVVTSFVDWLRAYRAGADMDHGYGFPRLRRTPQSPIARYAEQLKALETRSNGQGFATLSPDARRVMLEEAIAAAKIERLPGRPDGGHIATDLMSFYFNSGEAHDRAYRASIGRDACRGLEGSGERPARIS